MKLGFVGAGNMAAAMARGWAGADGGPERMAFTDGGSGRAAALAEEVGGEVSESNDEIAAGADLVMLAVKPAQLTEVAPALRDAATPVISLLGGTSLSTLAEALPGLPVVRVMPNLPAEVRRGVLCYATSDEVGDELRATVVELLGQLGNAIALDDDRIDAATAIMGCPPAYLALVAETLIDAGVREGLAEPQATEMVVETFAGTAALLSRRSPEEVRDAVASRGGSTEAGLAALEEGEVPSDIRNAVNASLGKMRG
jgi:pyrroline-5-carboxylate reductase